MTDPDAIEIGRLYRKAWGVTDARYFSEKTSHSRNADSRFRVTPDACHWCREPFAVGQVRYPIMDEVEHGSGWGLVCICGECFRPQDLGVCQGAKLVRYERNCAGCGQPMFTPVVGPFRWQVCSSRCQQRLYRKRRRGQGSTVDWKAQSPKCETCKKPIRSKRRDSRFCSNACRQWAYRRRATP